MHCGIGLVGVPKEEALAFSIPLHLVELGPVFILGALSSFSAHVRLREYMAPDALAEQDIMAGPTCVEGDSKSINDSVEETDTDSSAVISIRTEPE